MPGLFSRREKRRKPPQGDAIDFAHPLAHGLVVAWLFREAGTLNTDVLDASTSNNTGTYGYGGGSTPTIIPAGPFAGPARAFSSGSSTTVGHVTPSNIPLGASARTIVVWSRRTDTVGGALVSWGPTSGAGGQSWIHENYQTGGTNYVFTDGVNAGNNLSVSSGDWPAQDVWSQTVLTLNGADGYAYYLNGTSRLSGTFGTSISTAALGANGFGVGTRTDGVPENFTGDLDHVLVYSRALSAGEVAWLYNEPFAFVRPRKRWRMLGDVAAAAPAGRGKFLTLLGVS